MAALIVAGCSRPAPSGPAVVTFPGSVLGAEGEVLRRQLARFMREHPGIRVEQRRTPDAADQRHQLYVQWLNARASDPDILQLDAIWTPEFAAAEWILPLDRFHPDTAAFYPATIAANRWNGRLYGMPWFVDVGMLYWRTDLAKAPPSTFDQLDRVSEAARASGAVRTGLVYQGARYEGLITVFLEYLGACGGTILEGGRVRVADPPAVRALTLMLTQLQTGVVPRSVLTWHEEEARFAFQNGQAAFMRNWPYAYSLLQDTAGSTVAGRFAVAPMPAAAGGAPTAALGGAQLAINANSEHPEAAWAVIDFLTRPEQMLERAQVVGQFPARRTGISEADLARVLSIPPAQIRAVVERAVPRPVTPVYTQLSDILQIQLHRALTRQMTPTAALREAQTQMQRLLDRVGLGAGSARASR